MIIIMQLRGTGKCGGGRAGGGEYGGGVGRLSRRVGVGGGGGGGGGGVGRCHSDENHSTQWGRNAENNLQNGHGWMQTTSQNSHRLMKLE